MFPCVEDLRDASFRGVSFFVENDDEDYARRIVTHEYANRNVSDHEDMGERYQAFNVNGYITGPDAIEHKDALALACRLEGPALLILPALEPFMAVCLSVKVSRSKDKQGYFTVTMTFRADEDSEEETPFVTGEFEGLILASAEIVVAALQAASTVFVVKDVLQYVTDDATYRVKVFATEVADFIEQATFDFDQTNVEGVNLAVRMSAGAPTLCAQPSTLIAGINQLLKALVYAAPAEEVLKDLRSFMVFDAATPTPVARTSVPEDDGTGNFIPVWRDGKTSVSEQQNLVNANFFNGVIRKLGAVFYGLALSRTTFSTRAEAITVRADVVEVFGREISDAQNDETLYLALTDARDHIVKYISQSMINTVPVIEISAPSPMPAIYWAYRLYDDPNRADELVTRNAVVDPAYIPSTFEALAR
jgi:prophage DNA circulation protein